MDKYQLQKTILQTALRNGTTEVTQLVMRDAFAELAPLEQDIIKISFAIDRRDPGPLTMQEQIEKFCEVNGLESRQIVETGNWEFRLISK